MSYLLYCVFHEQGLAPAELPPGVDRQSVFVLSCQGLTAAVSELAVPQPDRTDFSHLLAYERAVTWFHRRGTVIPMRYGSIFAELSEITGLL
ncbi:MAG: GvpL/GvpF family gas vesicle protein, partial [Acidobacteria bacterium]|nr:GvpL/GvpF family gas vesicle protein [Acidobacteriota bacterium]